MAISLYGLTRSKMQKTAKDSKFWSKLVSLMDCWLSLRLLPIGDQQTWRPQPQGQVFSWSWSKLNGSCSVESIQGRRKSGVAEQQCFFKLIHIHCNKKRLSKITKNGINFEQIYKFIILKLQYDTLIQLIYIFDFKIYDQFFNSSIDYYCI